MVSTPSKGTERHNTEVDGQLPTSSPTEATDTSAQKSLADQIRQPALNHRERPFSQTVLNIGFLSALLLSGACLVMSGYYLYDYLTSTSSGIQKIIGDSTLASVSEQVIILAINARMVMARLALLSCGVFVGMSFGFLGFALFLLGIEGEMSMHGQIESYQVKIARMSPGVFVILCAAVLIGYCASHKTPFEFTANGSITDQRPPLYEKKIDPKI